MRSLVVLLPLALVLAGCVGGGPQEPADEGLAAPSLHAVPPSALEAGGAYAFDHPGGALRVGSKEGAEVVLHGPDDARLARIPLEPGREAALDVPRGEAVLRILAVNGTLDVATATGPVALLRPLPVHMERVVLARQPQGPAVPEAAVLQQPLRHEGPVLLDRVPVDLRLLTDGDARDLEVTLVGDRGVALEAHEPYVGAIDSRFFLGGVHEVEAEVFHDNLGASAYRVQARAAHFEGALILESWSFSRARPLEPAGALAAAAPAALPYEYGALPDRPASFTVHEEATRLLFVNAGDAAASVVLFGPRDERLGTFPVAPAGSVAVPVAGGGSFVAAALSGEVVLGADRAPPDLDSLHVLERGTLHVPAQPPSGEGYAQAEEEAQVPGVLYDATPTSRPVGLTEPLAFGCYDAGTVRLVQEGETIGLWGEVPRHGLNVSRHLLDAPLLVISDGFGDGCSGPAFGLLWYRRPAEPQA